jgi:hypothetical protein
MRLLQVTTYALSHLVLKDSIIFHSGVQISIIPCTFRNWLQNSTYEIPGSVGPYSVWFRYLRCLRAPTYVIAVLELSLYFKWPSVVLNHINYYSVALIRRLIDVSARECIDTKQSLSFPNSSAAHVWEILFFSFLYCLVVAESKVTGWMTLRVLCGEKRHVTHSAWRGPVYVILSFGTWGCQLVYIYHVSKSWWPPFIAMRLLQVTTCALSHLVLKNSIICHSGGHPLVYIMFLKLEIAVYCDAIIMTTCALSYLVLKASIIFH